MSTISGAQAESIAGASEFTKSLFAKDSWSAAQVIDFVNERRNATIASVNMNGQPHAAVVIAASMDDEMYFTVAPQSVLARNLSSNERIAVSVCDSRHAVMAQGLAVREGAAPDLAELIDRLGAAAPSGHFTPDGWQGDIYRVDFRRLFAN